MAVIEINNLTKDYGEGRGIFDVSFSIDKGEVFGFLGPNGAGKTTTIRHLMGFILAKEGCCIIEGMDCGKEVAKISKELGYIPGEINLMDEMSGLDFIKFMANYRGMKDLGRAEELMERFELNPKGRIKKMSKGMKQKVGIVVAFMHDPQVLILDEPTSGLDPLMQNTFVELIKEEKEKGKTILMSSHMFEEVEKTCDRVGIIKEGRMVSVDDIDALRQSKKIVYSITFKKESDIDAFLALGYEAIYRKGTNVQVHVKGDINDFVKAVGTFSIQSLEMVHQSLEEVFMQFYGGDKHE